MHQAEIRQAEAAALSSADRGLLRIVTCGTVDDGKSTLIGRLLYDLEFVPEDQLEALERDSRHAGSGEDTLEFNLLLDGLEAEREQGITIDVAYRYFSTARRTFVVADVPGHEQYTRNMASGVSVSDAALVLVDARNGVTAQTLRHSLIAAHFGIRHVVLAINKFDLVGFSESVFNSIAEQYRAASATQGFSTITAIPISARYGDNIVRQSAHMPWHRGPTVLGCLEEIDVESDRSAGPLRLPVQWICRADRVSRGLAGTVASGELRLGDPVVVACSGVHSKITRILVGQQERTEARAGDAVMVVLADEIDVSRGDVLARPDAAPDVSDQFAAHVLWLGASPMIPGRSYLLKIGARTVPASVTALKSRIDVHTGASLAGKMLYANEIGVCNVAAQMPIAFDRFADCRGTGAFILIDRSSNATVGAGMIDFSLRRASTVRAQRLEVAKEARTVIKGHRPAILWLTGLSGAGKSTIANMVESRLNALGAHTYLLDGDNIRRGISRDLGFTEVDRVENIRRVAEVACLFVEAGLIVIVSLISPFRSERQLARELVGPKEFIEIFVDAPFEVCRQRDPKGLYARAARGELVNFTGIDSPYEPPLSPELRLPTVEHDSDTLAGQVIAYLREEGILDR